MKKTQKRKPVSKKIVKDNTLSDIEKIIEKVLPLIKEFTGEPKGSRFARELDIIEKASVLIGAEQTRCILMYTPQQAGERYATMMKKVEDGEATLRDRLEINLFNFLKA